MKVKLVSNPAQEEYINTDEKPAQQCQKRLAGADRRTQLIAVAAELFARRGLLGTTTKALADAARIAEPILYLHFQNKEQLYRAAVERNIEARLKVLNERPSTIY